MKNNSPREHRAGRYFDCVPSCQTVYPPENLPLLCHRMTPAPRVTGESGEKTRARPASIASKATTTLQDRPMTSQRWHSPGPLSSSSSNNPQLRSLIERIAEKPPCRTDATLPPASFAAGDQRSDARFLPRTASAPAMLPAGRCCLSVPPLSNLSAAFCRQISSSTT